MLLNEIKIIFLSFFLYFFLYFFHDPLEGRVDFSIYIYWEEDFTIHYSTPLHNAAKHNSKEIGELLISKGVDIDAKNIIYQIIIILSLINLIWNRLKK